MSHEAVFHGFGLPKDKSAKGPLQRDRASEISAEGGLDVTVGNSACSFLTMSLGKPRFRGVFQRGVSEVFQKVFQTPVA